jgi:foldase protein PrsA
MGNFLKKNWFICVLVVALGIVSTYYIVDTSKGKLKGKTVNGEDVVYEINGIDVTASQFYDDMYQEDGIAALYHAFMKAVVDQSVETTDDMQTEASSRAYNLINSYISNYGSSYQSTLDSQLKSMGYVNGYDDLEEYFIDYAKVIQIAEDYAKAHFDELQIRNISYILIAAEQNESGQPGVPSETQQAKMDKVDEELAAGTDFAVVAADNSEDSSTASSGGVLGTIDKNASNLDIDFLEAALSLNEGEISDWIYSSSFGFFKIKCNAATPDTLETVAKQQAVDTANGKDYTTPATPTPNASALPDASASAQASALPSASASAQATVDPDTVDSDPYYDLVTSYDTSLMGIALWDKAEELGLTFASDDDRAALRSYMGLEPEDTGASATDEPEATGEAQ